MTLLLLYIYDISFNFVPKEKYSFICTDEVIGHLKFLVRYRILGVGVPLNEVGGRRGGL